MKQTPCPSKAWWGGEPPPFHFVYSTSKRPSTAGLDDEEEEAEVFTRQLLAKAAGKAVPLPGEKGRGAFYGAGRGLDRRQSSMGQSDEDVRVKASGADPRAPGWPCRAIQRRQPATEGTCLSWRFLPCWPALCCAGLVNATLWPRCNEQSGQAISASSCTSLGEALLCRPGCAAPLHIHHYLVPAAGNACACVY